MTVVNSSGDLWTMIGASEFRYPLLIFLLFVVPRFLARYGVPLAISAFALGLISNLGFSGFRGDPTVGLLASLGIISLFLFAGLEVQMSEIRPYARVLIQHLVIRCLLLAAFAAFCAPMLSLELQAASLLALALLTPSTGFILDTLDAAEMEQHRKFWIKSKAIAAELIALALMFVAVKSGDLGDLFRSSALMLALLIALPVVFKVFAKVIAPFAPKSEFGFLLMVAILAGMVTKKLGAYYLVGAFLVGLTARRFEDLSPDLTSLGLIKSLKGFVSFFTPFYFFSAGLSLSSDALSWQAAGLALVFAAVAIPIRVASVVIHRRISMGEAMRESMPIAISLLPNLVFGLVLVEILDKIFNVHQAILGGLIGYTMLATLLPPLWLRLFKSRPAEVEFSRAHGDMIL